MTSSSIYEDGERLLPPDVFTFELDAELRRAVRLRSDLTLVVLTVSSESDDDVLVQDIARVIGKRIRDTDLLGTSEPGTLTLALLDADLERSTPVINRLLARIDGERPTAAAVRIAVGAACYPTHAVDGASLKREAIARTIGGRPGAWPVSTLHADKA